jgi:hypothetical protein
MASMNFLRFLLLLSLAVWIGSLIFFPMVAETSFSVLPSTHEAGLVVGGALIKLHWMGMVSGVVFLVCSLVYARVALGKPGLFALAEIIVVLMLVLTAVSQFAIIPKMDSLRRLAGEISSLGVTDPVRAQFDSLHAWSVRIEQAVLLLGLVALYSVARRLSPRA